MSLLFLLAQILHTPDRRPGLPTATPDRAARTADLVLLLLAVAVLDHEGDRRGRHGAALLFTIRGAPPDPGLSPGFGGGDSRYKIAPGAFYQLVAGVGFEPT